MLRLASGSDVLVGISERDPLVRHQGLFGLDTKVGHYVLPEPKYDTDSATTGCRNLVTSRLEALKDWLPPSASFLLSQFDYYRGEQAPAGFWRRGPRGLEASVRFLKMAVTLDPQNPLPVYLLGYVRKQRRLALAKKVPHGLPAVAKLRFCTE